MCSAKTVTFGPVVAYPKPPAAGNIEQTKARFNCIGTLRDSLKMVGSNGSKLLTIRLVRSKLRKREESAAAATATAAAAATTNGNAGGAATINAAVAVNNNCINNNNNVDCQLPPAPSSPPPPHGQPAADVVQASAVPADVVDAPVPLPFLWQYSAKNAAAKNAATNGYNSSPYRLYTSDQVTYDDERRAHRPVPPSPSPRGHTSWPPWRVRSPSTKTSCFRPGDARTYPF